MICIVSVIIVNICDTVSIGGDAGIGCKKDVKPNGRSAAINSNFIREVKNVFLFAFLLS